MDIDSLIRRCAAYLGAVGSDGDLRPWFYLLLFPVLVIAGLSFFGLLFLGLKLNLPSAETILQRDRRPPILYLRSFKHDAGFRKGYESAEIMLQVFGSLGPIVAIGKPGDRLPKMGVLRFYVGEESWQAKVLELIGKSQAVILVQGDTEGLHWELAEVVRRCDPRRVLLVFPTRDPALFAKLLDNAAETIPSLASVPIPEGVFSKPPLLRLTLRRKIEKPYSFFTFDSQWTARFVELQYARYNLWRMLSFTLQADYEATLSPFIRQLRQLRQFPISEGPARIPAADQT